MSGEWIKVEKATAQKFEIVIIANALGIPTDHALGLCIRFWSICDSNMISGNAASVTKAHVDLLLGVTGFAESLEKVGWLRVRNGSLEVPNFDRHLSQSAKKRALSANRKAKFDAKSLPKSNAVSVTSALPEEEEEEEEEELLIHKKKNKQKKENTAPENIPLPDSIDTPEFRAAWFRWLDYRRSRKKPVTASMASEQIRWLADLGNAGAIESINTSIRQGYQGLFEPKDQSRGPPTAQPQRLAGDIMRENWERENGKSSVF